MFGLPSVKLGRPFGIPLEIDASWFLILFLVASSLTTSYFPQTVPDLGPVAYVALGLGTALAFFASLVLHELAHSLVALAGGVKITRVTLFLFGGVSQMEDEPRGPGHEFLLAMAGPVTSLLIGGAAWLVRQALYAAGAVEAAWVPFEYLALINVMLALFNLLPGFPLDGGRVLRAVLWAITGNLLKATKWASRAGQTLGVLLITVAVFGVLNGTFDFIWFAVMGWFLSTLSASAYQNQLVRAALAAIPLRQIMSTPAILAPAELSLAELADGYFLGGRHKTYPVLRDGHVIGLVSIDHVNAVARGDWPSTTVADVASRDLEKSVAPPDASVESVLGMFDASGPGAVLVVDEGRLSGIVTRSDIIRVIRESVRRA